MKVLKAVVPIAEEDDEDVELPNDYVEDGPDGMLFDAFGAEVANGVPIGQVFGENVEPDVAANNPVWENIELQDEPPAVKNRRDSETQASMIPPFLAKKSGHKNVPQEVTDKASALDFLCLYLSPNILDTFVTKTNEYASAKPAWQKALGVRELLYFICIVVFMGV